MESFRRVFFLVTSPRVLLVVLPRRRRRENKINAGGRNPHQQFCSCNLRKKGSGHKVGRRNSHRLTWKSPDGNCLELGCLMNPSRVKTQTPTHPVGTLSRVRPSFGEISWVWNFSAFWATKEVMKVEAPRFVTFSPRESWGGVCAPSTFSSSRGVANARLSSAPTG